ncbi:differentially expressed in FDCP 8 homolog B-like isoform X2 [Lineus longissimus]|uniref:differentially expressed in FDCP 8 homolog B-like isoform X2 n=1 Tax=Lineus longissimus TaxID=88925 RepID=UPI00315CF837
MSCLFKLNLALPICCWHPSGKEKRPDSKTPLRPRKQEKLFTSTFTPCMPLQCLSRTNSDDYPRSVSSDDSGFLVKDENDITFADLGLAEDHFSQPEGSFGLSTTEELELAIESCKELIMETGDNVERKTNLVGKLIQLRMRLQDAKDGFEERAVDVDTKLVLGHKFTKKETHRSKHYCEKCNNVIWGVLQVWYRCSECGFCCHGKCLNLITRMCASIKVGENPSYILSICPEKGLALQQYRCSECRTVISFKSNYDEPRQCDYTGNYYCEQCHWNDTMVIPARVLHNWDFEPMKVCRASKQFLKLMTKRSVLRIQDINPMLFSFIEELNEVKKLREEILVMKKYFLSCQDALASKLLLQLKDRQHFVDNSDIYSMQDLLDIASDALVPKLTKIHASFAQHIKADCELCQVKGFICELCDSQEILFPFDNHAIVCSQCSAVLHRHCYMKRENSCPRCERRNKRSTDES